MAGDSSAEFCLFSRNEGRSENRGKIRMKSKFVYVRIAFFVVFILCALPMILFLFDMGVSEDRMNFLGRFVISGSIVFLSLFYKDFQREVEDEMRKKGIVGSSLIPLQGEIGLAVFALSTTGRILDAAIAGRVSGKLRPMEEYVGLTIEEARQLVKSKRERSIFWSKQKEEREKVILAALDDAEENLRKFHAKSEELRNKSLANGNAQIEEPEDSLWEEE